MENHGKSWDFIGISKGFSWKIMEDHGISWDLMGFHRDFIGIFMGFSWKIMGFNRIYMDKTGKTHVKPTDVPGTTHGFSR